MSTITDLLHKEIESLDPTEHYKEPICMLRVSKDWRGRFEVAESDQKPCANPQCTTVKALVNFKAEIRRHDPCDAPGAGGLDGTITGLLAFSYINDGQQGGYHVGRLDWSGANSKLIGRMKGVTNAGTHRPPLMQCERCHNPGHMEGCLEAVVVDGEHQGCRLIATYAIAFDPSVRPQDTDFRGTLEGVLICDCSD